MSRTGVMICGHGSRSQAAVDEFAVLAEKLPAYLPEGWETEYGYLEFANPVIRDGLDRLREKGCDRILAVPGMLFAAMHAKNDIPTVLNSYAAQHGIEVSYGRELGVDPKMIAAAGARVQSAVDRANAEQGDVPLTETCLVVIGRGASDPDANANVAKIARMLWEGMGFGWCAVGYSGVTFPLVEPCLQHVAKLGYRRVIVFPYFLFTGILIDRIYGFTDQVAAEHPSIQFVKAGYLNDHPKVLETFAERVMEQGGRHAAARTARSAGYRDPGAGARRRPPPDHITPILAEPPAPRLRGRAAAHLRALQVPHRGAGLRGRGRRGAGKPPPPCRRAGRLGPGLERGRLHALRHLLHRALPARGAGPSRSPPSPSPRSRPPPPSRALPACETPARPRERAEGEGVRRGLLLLENTPARRCHGRTRR
jgi:sirohydrochlorin ferrochelatase